MANKESDDPDMKKNNSKETITSDKNTYLCKGELFTGKTPDIRDIHKMMPERRIIKLNKETNTDRSLNKIMEDTPGN